MITSAERARRAKRLGVHLFRWVCCTAVMPNIGTPSLLRDLRSRSSWSRSSRHAGSRD
jgi:hypothetical protein